VLLGTADSFGVLAGTTITNTGITLVMGDMGMSPGTAVTGFPPGIASGTTHVADGVADTAKDDLLTAHNDAAGRTGSISVSGDLGGVTLTPGIYKSTSSLAITSGILTLDAQGDPSRTFIFQIASTLITGSATQIVLSGGAQAQCIFWQVGSSATLGTNSTFKGTIMALTSITATTGMTMDGRLLASNGAVTMDTNTITVP
jgi:type VI secretion system secreted protein VgrG